MHHFRMETIVKSVVGQLINYFYIYTYKPRSSHFIREQATAELRRALPGCSDRAYLGHVLWWTEIMKYFKPIQTLSYFQNISNKYTLWILFINKTVIPKAEKTLIRLLMGSSLVPQGTRRYTIRTKGSLFFLFTCPVSSHCPSFLDTYSADFQKCPGWDSLRLSLGSFSSMSASWVKVGLSLRS